MQNIFFDKHADLTITWRDRPHWKQPGKVHFVTWRMADGIPKARRDELLRDRAAWIAEHGTQDISTLSEGPQRAYYRLFQQRVQRWLDAGHGSCALLIPAARDIMRDTLVKFHNERYRLGTFAIAGNHVHVLVVPFPGYDLSELTHSWKSYTAKVINRLVGRTGKFWKTESFDHLVRSWKHLQKYERYIRRHTEQGGYVEVLPLL